MKILVLTRYERNGASSRTRHYNFETGLKAQGIELTFSPLLTAQYLECLYAGKPYAKTKIISHYIQRLRTLMRTVKFDAIWCEKEAFPFLPGQLEQWILPRKIPIILDFDDAWWFRYQQHSNPVFRILLRNKFATIVKNATIVTASNPLLVRDLEKMGARDVRLVPVALAINDYLEAAQSHSRPSISPLKVGWIGTAFTANLYLPMITNVLNNLVAQNICEIHLIGAGDAVPDLKAQRHDWSEQTEIDLIASHDIGIMPLKDDSFSRGKSAYKLLQYMACAKPIIGSPVGINKDFFMEKNKDSERLGFGAPDEDTWHKHILFLAKNRVSSNKGT